MTNPFVGITVACCCEPSFTDCMCGDSEKVLRAYIDGRRAEPMTPEQRAWCLAEIDSVEGFKAEDHVAEADAQLARTVLDAWTDYCRDKGMM